MIWTRSDLSRRSPWTKADIRQARQVALKPVLERLGYRLAPLKNGNYIIAGMAPEIIVKDHYWICTDTGVAGNAIDFLVKVKNMSFNEAIQCLRQPVTS